jgi:hypothetical protein
MKRGRPRLDPADTSTSVHFKLPSKTYAATIAEASSRRLTLSEYIRQSLKEAKRLEAPARA